MTVFRNIIGAVVIFVAGAVLGPVVIAMILAFDDETQGYYPHNADQAERLTEVYQANLPNGLFFNSIYSEPHVKNCGYEEAEIFPDGLDEIVEARQNGRLSLLEGYDAVDRWARRSQEIEYLASVTQVVQEEHSAFQLEFLRRCIQGTLFSGMCMKHVAKFGERVERFPEEPRGDGRFAGAGYEDEVICTYLDGVAARRGLAIPER